MTPLLPLEDFRRILGWNPFHFWGLANADVPVTQACPSVLKEYAWQHVDAAGRAEIRAAIESAESLLRDYFGYAVAPEYREVTMPWPRFFDNSRTRIGQWDATGRWIAPKLDGVGYVQAAGVESLALIGTAAKSDPPVGGDTLVFSDRDGDGLDDTFTITMATIETDPDKIAVYFVAADRLDDDPVGARWRIQPAQVQITAGVATIIGRLWLLVRPIKYQGVNPQPQDPGDITASGPYAQSLGVYLRTTDPNGITIDDAQATVIWETRPCHGWWCCCGCQSATYDPAGAIRDPAAIASALARVTLRDGQLGLVGIGPACYNVTTGLWVSTPWGTCNGEPDRVTVRVYAGYPLENQAMAKKFQTVVARLAMAELARPVCACESANRELHNWQFDLARSAGANDETFGFISREDLANPLGTRRGAVFAWKQIRNLRQTVGMTGF